MTRGSEISEIDVAQVEIILGLLDGYEVIIIESRKPFVSKKIRCIECLYTGANRRTDKGSA